MKAYLSLVVFNRFMKRDTILRNIRYAAVISESTIKPSDGIIYLYFFSSPNSVDIHIYDPRIKSATLFETAIYSDKHVIFPMTMF